ncbi:MAG: hemerythrin [Hyphomicrobiales bacterium]|nr:MAG: hemerythrin [Hyphomicrobiales bacterium]
MMMVADKLEFPATGDPMIDEDHAEFAEMVVKFETLADDELAPTMDALAKHLAEHFAREEKLMTKTGFPAYVIHKGEHERVLNWVASIKVQLRAGDVAAVREFLAKDVREWFVTHAATMDTATANWARNRVLAY